MNSEADDFFKSLEEQGEDTVRAKLAAKQFAEKKQGLVNEWLRRKNQERDDLLKHEEIAIARDAAAAARDAADAARDSADAARDAADEAKQANIIAKIAIAIAAIATIISIISVT